ncbi:CoA transferase [Actinomadura madurae]|uniref:CoA transferase n=1 Tax=Actinomadura madurae TaxID=1993 RepID=UPI0020D2103F|nr:CoA transferase [Actinomadura madurae]
MGREGERPVPPLNLLGDFGGGGMLLALGLVSALFAARRDGRGQVVDAAILDGTALLGTVIHDFLAEGGWADRAASTCSTAARPSTTPTPAPTAASSRSGRLSRLLRRSRREARPAGRGGACRPAPRPRELADDPGPADRDLRHPHPRRVGRLLR